jgi:hypothetical protein
MICFTSSKKSIWAWDRLYSVSCPFSILAIIRSVILGQRSIWKTDLQVTKDSH